MAAAALRHAVYCRADWARRAAGGAKVAEPEAVPDSPEDRHLTAISAFIVGLRTAPAFSTLAYLLGLAWRVLRREIMENQSGRVAAWMFYWLDIGINPAKLLALQVWKLANRQPGKPRQRKPVTREPKLRDINAEVAWRMGLVSGELRKALWREIAVDAYLAAEGCLKGMPRMDGEPEDSVDDDALLEPCAPPDLDAVTRWVLVGRDGLEAMGYFDFTDELPPHPPEAELPRARPPDG
ncbi:MAG: hypothetical protein U1E14_19505 [Geminicoccaceae bacterium]